MSLTILAVAAATNKLAFYEAAAQVIPILFIVLAIEMRLFYTTERPRWFHRLDRLLTLSMLLLISVGEVAAFHMIDTGHDEPWAHGLTAAVLLFEGVAVVLVTWLLGDANWRRQYAQRHVLDGDRDDAPKV